MSSMVVAYQVMVYGKYQNFSQSHSLYAIVLVRERAGIAESDLCSCTIVLEGQPLSFVKLSVVLKLK